MAKDHSKRIAINHASQEWATKNGQLWCQHELELLFEWDRTPEQLQELAELLERTVEACRERYYKSFRDGGTTTVTTTETHTTTKTTTYRGWMEGDGDGWD